MTTIRVGGVPEHFNLPWHLCIEEGDFKHEDIEIIWRDFPDGTGAMNQALRNNEIDVAIILTEGIIKDIIAGNPSRIVQEYIGSPLIWGIHVAHNSRFTSVRELEGAKAAISRIGSGSQLMAYVNAKNQDWNTENLDFEIVGDIDGAVDALTSDRAQYFMWEYFTTKPLVDREIFRRVANCPTPWPCFVIAAGKDILEENPQEIKKMLEVVNNKTRGFKEIPGIEVELATRYGQKIPDIEKWLQKTSWSRDQITEEELSKVQNTLKDLGLIDNSVSPSKIISNL